MARNTDNTRLDLSCFQDHYRHARQHLLDGVARLPAGLIRQQQAFDHPLPGPDGQPLYLDWLWLGQAAQPEQVLVLISGTHGVEGFAGSAIQCHWLPMLASQLQQQPGLGVIIIHALNPWGFAWLRRYDHEGIDQNRNFIDFTAPLPRNPEYDLIHDELLCDTSRQLDTVLAHWQTQLGKQPFETAITQGQYQHADGLFYGGTAPSWSHHCLQQACANAPLQQAKKMAVIDLHTGLGPFGHGEVINDHTPGSPGFALACQWYGANAQSALLGESCSPPKTGLLDYFWHELLGARGCFVTLEYGTYALDKLLLVSCEEQRYHNGLMLQQKAQHTPPRQLEDAAVTALRDFFYPRDDTWRELVLFRAGQIMRLALQGILT